MDIDSSPAPSMSYFYLDDADSARSFQLPGSRPHYNPDRPGQVKHIFLDLQLDIPQQVLQGTCRITLQPVRSQVDCLVLDAVDLQIQAVRLDDREVRFSYDGEALTIGLTEPLDIQRSLEIAIDYRADRPQRGIYFIAPNADYPDKPTQVWTQGEDEDSRYWFPCFDYPGQLATSEIRVAVPQGLRAISNGQLIDLQTVDNQEIYHWRQDQVHPTYLMTLAVGRFAEIADRWQDKPVNYYVEQGQASEAHLSMGKTPAMVEFFSQKFGYPYPFAAYNQVCVDDFIFGGMENTGTTLLTARCLLDERASLDNRNTESLVAHELAHQWFGDLVVIKHWSHAWIKEGMATYSEVLWTDHSYGPEEAAYYMLGEMESYLSEDSSRYRRPIVTNIYREAIELYDRHLYEKGACVYHMIRAHLGDELFDRFVHTFVQNNAHRTVETIDLLRAIDQATGRNLAFLLDQYVYRGGHPDYKVAYKWDSSSQMAQITITQTQAKEGVHTLANDLFDLTIPIAFGTLQDGEVSLQTVPVRIFEKEQVLYFPLAQKPDFIGFDRGNYHLKTVELDYPLGELTAQLHHDPDPIGKVYAARAIGKKSNLAAVQALTDCLDREPFWAVRQEAAQALTKIPLPGAITGLLAHLQDPEPRVRRAIVNQLATLKTPESYQALTALVTAGDPSYYVEADACRALGAMTAAPTLQAHRPEVRQLLQQVLTDRGGWNEVVRSGAIGGLATMTEDPEALQILLTYTQAGVPQPLRLATIRALGAISVHQAPVDRAKILDRLGELARESFFLTQVATVTALGQIPAIEAVGLLQNLAQGSPDGRVKRMAAEAIERVQKQVGTEPALKQLRQEMEELKTVNRELRGRLEAIEARQGAAQMETPS
jgi:aminopeptidase N